MATLGKSITISPRFYQSLIYVVSLISMTGCWQQVSQTPDGDQEFRRQAQQCQSGGSTDLVVRQQVSDTAIADLPQLPHVTVLELYRADLSSRSLELIAQRLPGLKRIRLGECRVDDPGLLALCELRQLEVLNLPDSKFTDKGVRAIAGLPKLELIRFGSPNVTDEGLKLLATAASLRFLHLLEVPITDVGVAAFHGVDRLESLYIDGGQETDAGIRDLLRANPNLHFHQNQVHVPHDPNADDHEL